MWGTGKSIGKHVISMYSKIIFQMVKIRDVKKYQQDIKNDLIIRDQILPLFYFSCACASYYTYSQQVRSCHR